MQYMLRRLPAQEFARDKFDVFRRANTGRDRQIDFDEVWEVCKLVPLPQAVRRCRGQRRAPAFGEQKQGLGLD
jgi:hypothetical protein